MNRPRPRTFSTFSLATQQLKLRNLTRIQGFNFDHDNKDVIFEGIQLVYYSLHHSPNDDAFYRSEALPLQLQQKWSDIVCPNIVKSNKNCVCVKVWIKNEKKMHPERDFTKNEKKYLNIDALKESVTMDCFPTVKLLFSWAVYFSGLKMLTQTDVTYKKNCLTFHLNDFVFSSPEYFTVNTLKENNSLYQRCPVIQNCTSNSPQVSRSSSPVAFEHQQMEHIPTKNSRAIRIYCLRTEVRTSYSLEVLLKLQEKQRFRMQKLRECVNIATDIRYLSLHCVTPKELQRRTRSASSSFGFSNQQQLQYHSMGRKLSILLAEEKYCEPSCLLRAQKLEKKLESGRCTYKLLLLEKSAFQERNNHLKCSLLKLKTIRKQQQNCLKLNIQQLKEEKDLLNVLCLQNIKLLQHKIRTVQNVERRMSSLCLELQEIYPIKWIEHEFFTICGVPFQINDHNKINSLSLEQISPLALSASLGYVAHLAQMISVILDQPLRNPIIHEGSRSRIQDIIKEVPYGSRDFPLYSRSLLPSKLVKYAIFLLNQNIAQLSFDISQTQSDLRATIENLQRIFKTFEEIQQNYDGKTDLKGFFFPKNVLNVHEEYNNGGSVQKDSKELSSDEIDSLLKSQLSIDQNGLDLQPILQNIQNPFLSSERVPIGLSRNWSSRSVGSYSDCENVSFEDGVAHSFSNSDSNIAFL